MVECGMTPMQAIVAATKTAAECAHLPDAGTIEPGKLADVLLVDGDPTEDIAVLADRSKLALIMKGGRTHRSTL
jgi:imidazolonepropionase-like amidohydrolase